MKKIGDIFWVEGEEVIVVPPLNERECTGCIREGRCAGVPRPEPCSINDRPDKKDVVFMPVQEYIAARMKNA